MKLIKSWEDTKYKATNYLYELPKGTKVLHTKDPKTTDTRISIAANAGSNLELMVDVPSGTAHFLEHILAGDINKYFKSKRQTDNFEYGNKRRSLVSANAYTSSKIMSLYATTNSKYEDRAGKRVLSMIDFPMELAHKKIEKERKIIIAERNEKPKKELSPLLHLLNLIFGEDMPEYAKFSIGEVSTIKEITVDHLTKFHDTYFTKDNLMISVQSSQDISKKLLHLLELMDESVSESKETLKLPNENLSNFYRYDHYQEPKAQGIYFEMGFFQPKRKIIDYFQEISEGLMYRLLDKLMYDIIREKKGLIYSSDTSVNNSLTFNYNIRDISLSCDPNDLVTALDELYKIIFDSAEKYIKTKAGQRWFDNEMSKFIYPFTTTFDDSYAESKAFLLLNGFELWDNDKANEIALKVNPSDLINSLKQNLQNQNFYVWMHSSLDKEDVFRMYEKSEIHKHLSV